MYGSWNGFCQNDLSSYGIDSQTSESDLNQYFCLSYLFGFLWYNVEILYMALLVCEKHFAHWTFFSFFFLYRAHIKVKILYSFKFSLFKIVFSFTKLCSFLLHNFVSDAMDVLLRVNYTKNWKVRFKKVLMTHPSGHVTSNLKRMKILAFI